MKVKSFLYCITTSIVLMIVGCGDSGITKGEYVSGVLVDIEMCQEDSSHTTFLLEFEDGRVQKARACFRKPLMFHLNEFNSIKIDSNGTIISVEKSRDHRGSV